jgi:hypothetical protein
MYDTSGSWFDFKKRLGDLKDDQSSSIQPSNLQSRTTPSASTSSIGSFYSIRSPFNSSVRISQQLQQQQQQNQAEYEASTLESALASATSSPSATSPIAQASSSKASAFKVDAASMRQLSENLRSWPVAMTFLTQTRGLNADVV